MIEMPWVIGMPVGFGKIGTASSGNRGHSGRPGQRGGSSGGGSAEMSSESILKSTSHLGRVESTLPNTNKMVSAAILPDGELFVLTDPQSHNRFYGTIMSNIPHEGVTGTREAVLSGVTRITITNGADELAADVDDANRDAIVYLRDVIEKAPQEYASYGIHFERRDSMRLMSSKNEVLEYLDREAQ